MSLDKELQDFLTDIFEQYYDKLMRTAWQRMKNESDAKDIIGFTFYVATLKAKDLYSHPNKLAWLYKVLDLSIRKHNVVNATRQMQTDENGEKTSKYVYNEIISLNEEVIKEIAVSSESYGEDFQYEWRDILTEEEWHYIQLKYEYGFNTGEIAERIGKTYSGTTSFGSRVKNKIKKFFNERDK